MHPGRTSARLASLARSVVACGWFGIQTWIGGLAIHSLFGLLWPGWNAIGGDWAFMGYGLPHYLGFLIFWLINVYFVWAGTESIKWMETLAAPFLIAMGIALLAWAVSTVGGLGTILRESEAMSQATAAHTGLDLSRKYGMRMAYVTSGVLAGIADALREQSTTKKSE